jgi:hypothetical protein
MTPAIRTRPRSDDAPPELDPELCAELREVAAWVASRPWNRPGTEKSWVLAAMTASLEFQKQVRQAERVRKR